MCDSRDRQPDYRSGSHQLPRTHHHWPSSCRFGQQHTCQRLTGPVVAALFRRCNSGAVWRLLRWSRRRRATDFVRCRHRRRWRQGYCPNIFVYCYRQQHCPGVCAAARSRVVVCVDGELLHSFEVWAGLRMVTARPTSVVIPLAALVLLLAEGCRPNQWPFVACIVLLVPLALRR